MDHAGNSKTGSEYDDLTGQMGSSSKNSQDDFKCFNPAKSWQLGWYATQSRRINPYLDTPFRTKLRAITAETNTGDTIVDNGSTDPDNNNNNNNNKHTILQIPNGEKGDIFIGYNRANYFNSGTQEGINRIVIDDQHDKGGGRQQSNLLATLTNSNSNSNDGESFSSYIIPNYLDVPGTNLIIEMMERISNNDEAIIAIYLETNTTNEHENDTDFSPSNQQQQQQPQTQQHYQYQYQYQYQPHSTNGCHTNNKSSDENSNEQQQEHEQIKAQAQQIRFEVNVFTDKYPQDNSWTLVNDQTGELIASRYKDTFTSFTSHNDLVCLDYYHSSTNTGTDTDTDTDKEQPQQHNTYTFTFFDSYGEGDGICCRGGYGSYSVFLDGTEIFRGGEFQGVNSVSHTFTVVEKRRATTTSTTTDSYSNAMIIEQAVMNDTDENKTNEIETIKNNDEIIRDPASSSSTSSTTATSTTTTINTTTNTTIRGKCDDDSKFRYRGKKKKSCKKWVTAAASSSASKQEKESLTKKRCQKQDLITDNYVSYFCPSICNTECVQ